MLPELPLWEGVVRMLVAGTLAGLIGLERERSDQEAGLRTHILVAGGACLFMIVGVYGWSDFTFNQRIGAIVDPSRVASYVVAGIGFLGGGAIIKYGPNIKGLTTAASVWVTAAIGVAVGVGMYALALATTLLVLFSLWPLRTIARRLGLRGADLRRLVVEVDGGGAVGTVVAAVEDTGATVELIRVADEAETRTVELVLGEVVDARTGALLEAVASLASVKAVEWAR
ncbi:MAG TPA: MgtC/SapB family protein [Gaiellaceae bacterium]|nr:MgtC/SapB family protein [Gaiellaceae bacterium]